MNFRSMGPASQNSVQPPPQNSFDFQDSLKTFGRISFIGCGFELRLPLGIEDWVIVHGYLDAQSENEESTPYTRPERARFPQ